MIRADDPSLTPFAGLAVGGQPARSLRLVELIDAEIAAEGRVAPFKRRRRGVTPGELVVSLAESQLIGGDCFDDIEGLRADRAGASLRAVAGVPSAPCARQLAARFARCQIQAVERALARAGQALDREVGRDRGEPATVDLDATRITVYGPGKRGAGRTRTGELAYAPHIATWAQRGRALTGELVGGNQEKLSGARGATIARRAIRLLGADHGPVDFRIDSAYHQLELLLALRKATARFTVSVPRNQAMWRIAAQIPEDAWSDATGMPGAQIIKARSGHKVAIGAVKHAIVIALYHMLKNGEMYRPPTPHPDAERKQRERTTKRLIAQLERLGHSVTLQEGAAAT